MQLVQEGGELTQPGQRGQGRPGRLHVSQDAQGAAHLGHGPVGGGLLSRVREQWDQTGDNTGAVATGLQRAGAIITSAALLLAVVIGAFSTSGVTFIKLIGVGMLIMLLLDATVVRGLLVPATCACSGTTTGGRPSHWHGCGNATGTASTANHPPLRRRRPSQHCPLQLTVRHPPTADDLPTTTPRGGATESIAPTRASLEVAQCARLNETSSSSAGVHSVCAPGHPVDAIGIRE
jgi:MMPL family